MADTTVIDDMAFMASAQRMVLGLSTLAWWVGFVSGNRGKEVHAPLGGVMSLGRDPHGYMRSSRRRRTGGGAGGEEEEEEEEERDRSPLLLDMAWLPEETTTQYIYHDVKRGRMWGRYDRQTNKVVFK